MKEVFNKPLRSDELKRAVAMYHFGLTAAQYAGYLDAVNEQNQQLKKCQEL
jgi:hypothetical protein